MTELATEAEALYNSILPVKGKPPLPHAFSYLYGKYFDANDDEAAVQARIVLLLYGPRNYEKVMVMDKLCVRAGLSADDLEHFQKKKLDRLAFGRSARSRLRFLTCYMYT